MKNLFILILFISALFSCQNYNSNERLVEIKTSEGTMLIKLYNETPLHRDNFIALADSGYFNDLLFHRVINTFMIQGGDPDSRNAEKGVRLGEGGPGYRVPAEFRNEIFHKKGVIAAAREGDKTNPLKESSGSQFYIVQGNIFTNEELDELSIKTNKRNFDKLFKNMLMDKQTSLMEEGKDFDMNELTAQIKKEATEIFLKTDTFSINEEERKIYTTLGGTPHLDGNYTVFGEVIKGMEIIDKIAQVETDENNRPLEDVKMKIKVIK